jgi:integrase
MSVKKRPDRELYRVSWREPSTGKVRSRNFKTETEALAFDLRIKAAKVDKSPLPGQVSDGVSFGEIALRYYSASVHRMSQHGMRSDLYILKGQILPVLGKTPAEKITRQDMDKLVASLKHRGSKANSIRRKLVIVKAALNWAVTCEIIPANPVGTYRVEAGPDAIIMPPSITEIEAILEHARPYLRRAILITLYTGVRPGPSELMRLTWMDADLAEGVLRVTSARKGGARWREIPLPAHLLTEMARWHAEDGGRGPIIHNKGEHRFRCLEAWTDAKRKAGITRRLRLYDLRHAFATYALGGGADLKSVADILGHATPSLTLKTYQHALSRNKRQAVNLVPTLGQHSGTTNGQEKAILLRDADNKVQ